MLSDIHINDVDTSIWAFWYSVLEQTDDLIHRIRSTPVTIDEWWVQKEIHTKKETDDPVSLGFATFFLNRTNRSGIVKAAGVIGGLDQSGPYKLDCRFNKEDLERRIRRVARYRNRIHLDRKDALAFIKKTNRNLPKSTFFCMDPPYFSKGQGLYTNFYKPEDHSFLAKSILALEKPWIVTYDNVSAISTLYKERRQYQFSVNYSLETKRRATELLIASKGLRVPAEVRRRQTNRT